MRKINGYKGWKIASAFLLMSYIAGVFLHKYLSVSFIKLINRKEKDIDIAIKIDPKNVSVLNKLVFFLFHLLFAGSQVLFTVYRI